MKRLLRRPTKRTLRVGALLGALLIVGGAIINVAVAWGRAWGIGITTGQLDRIDDRSYSSRGLPGWAGARRRFTGATRISIWQPSVRTGMPWPKTIMPAEAIPSWGHLALLEVLVGEAETEDIARLIHAGDCRAADARGWPLLSLWGGFQQSSPTATFTLNNHPLPQTVRIVHAIPVGQPIQITSDPFQVRVLPLAPIWPGFAINTIFYAGILGLLFTAPGFVRRRIRIKRGLCPACAYPVGSSDVCTECGAPLRIQRP